MGTYAADTSVSTERSRAEIERTLRRWGAEQFMYGWTGAVPALLPEHRMRAIER